jgi:uncharacterized protein (DUF58 family)
LDGLLQGDHAGLLPGHGSETGEARPYDAGDDTRRIDWSVTARTGEPHVRDTVADHELELWLVLDTSPSLEFGTDEMTKADLAWAAAGAMALLAARGGNRIGAVTTSGDHRRVPARSGREHVGALLAALHHARPRRGEVRAEGSLAGTLDALRRGALRRGMVVVASDFLDPSPWPRALRALAARHDVLVLEVVDRRELSLPNVGTLLVEDCESGRRRYLDTSSATVRDRYAEAALAQRDRIGRDLTSAGVEHVRLHTDRDWVTDLVRSVAARKARRHASRGALR